VVGVVERRARIESARAAALGGRVATVPESAGRVRTVALIIAADGRAALGTPVLGLNPVFCDRVDALLTLASSPDAGVVIAEPYDVNGVGVSAALAEIAAAPAAPETILVFDLTDRAVEQIREILDSGVVLRLAVRNQHGWARAVESARRDPLGQRPQRALFRRTVPFVDSPVRTFFAACALLADGPVRVHDAARMARLSPRTLEARLAKAGYPRAQTIAAWYRILYVAWCLDTEGLALKQLVGAGDEGLRARRALGNLVKRHTTLTLASLGAPGSFAALLHRFLTRLGVSLSKTTARR
jgi:hypothetical protein